VDWKPDIFKYLSYRRFLADYYEAGKANQRGFSYRYLARRAGFVAANFIKLVIDGKRNLGTESTHQVAEALRLTDEEHRFFVDLVAFDQASNDDERNEAFSRITASKRFREAHLLDAALYDYLSHWYYPVVRELAGRPDFIEEPEWIADHVLPAITPREASAALETLLRLRLLQRDGNGRVVRGEATLTSGHEVQALGVANFHRAMLQKASESIATVPQLERDLSAMTVCVSEERVPEVKKRLAEFREALMDFCDADPSPERVYQINIQFFPMSRGR
jgi:uncharacterized protein (TIGR02147 family)